MGLFDRFKKKTPEEIERENKLKANCGLPFTTETPQKKKYDTLRYRYEDVMATITGDVSGLQEGSVLYVNENGVVKNCASERIGIIDNDKLKAMCHDCFDKWKHGSTTAKFQYADDKIHLVLAFYQCFEDLSEFEDKDTELDEED